MTHRLTPLPLEPIDRAAALVRRSQPSPQAPSLSMVAPPEAIALIAEARSTRASCYASMEDMTDRVRRLSEDVSQMGVIVDLVDEEDEISMVNHIESISDSLGDEDVPLTIAAAGARR